ncbi:DLW-39 family protein [Solicola gregarius]|uniref:DLW-39 family protein n=1 Tax=Solicola gregarius TaxID=2908642 RepID=A0AA46TN06_9ACTN|nr:DLW-39 family protein [Solicola gregarius]UYM07373.1 DLW-39 family protein [Solicola gregarius]
MKKVLAIAVAVAGAVFLISRVRSNGADKDLWAEATDKV